MSGHNAVERETAFDENAMRSEQLRLLAAELRKSEDKIIEDVGEFAHDMCGYGNVEMRAKGLELITQTVIASRLGRLEDLLRART